MEDSIDVASFSINGNDYLLLKSVDFNNKKYILLVNEKDDDDFFIQEYKDGKCLGIDDTIDFAELLNKFKES